MYCSVIHSMFVAYIHNYINFVLTQMIPFLIASHICLIKLEELGTLFTFSYGSPSCTMAEESSAHHTETFCMMV